MKKLTRRDFLRSSAAGVAGVAITNMLGGSSMFALAEESDSSSDLEYVITITDPADEVGGGLRYCLPNGAIAEDSEMVEELDSEIRDFYDKGYNYIELALGVHDATLYASVDSDEWRNTLKAVYSVSNEIGMKVQLHMGFINSGEPFIIIDDGDEVEGEGSFRQKKLFTTNTVAFEGGSFPEELSLYGNAYNNAITPVAVLAIHYEETEEGKKQLESVQLSLDDFTGEVTEAIVEETEEPETEAAEVNPWEQATVETFDYSYVMTYTGAGESIGEAGELWEITGYYQVIDPSNESTSGLNAFTTSNYCIVDYFSVESAEAHTKTYMNKVFDDEIIELIKTNEGGFMYDGSDGHPATSSTTWSDGLLERFEEINGYDLTEYLGVIYSGYLLEEDEAERIAYDKLEALSSLYCDYLEYMTEWANSLNTTYIHQAGYSTSVNTVKVMMSVEQPEVESLDFRDNLGGYISVTGAAHMAGSNIISNEMGAMTDTNYGADVTPLIQSINIALASGVNQMILHSSSFKYFNDDEGYMWPGNALSYQNHPDFNATIPSWCVMGYVGEYIDRAQSAMQQGVAQRDVAVYLHLFSESEKNAEYFKSYEVMMSYGYTFDYMTPDMMAMDAAQTIEDGVIDPDGGAYKAFIVDPTTLLDGCRMATSSAEIILTYAEAGIPVLVIGEIPNKTESLTDDASNLAEVWSEIEATGNMYTLDSDSEIADKLIELGILANAQYENTCGIANYMRSTDEANYYFLYNRGDSYYIEYALEKADANTSIKFKGEGQPYKVNLWNGEATKLGDYIIEDGYTSVNISLEVDEATVIIIDKTDEGSKHAVMLDDTNDYYTSDDGNLYLRAYSDGEYAISYSDGTESTASVSGIATVSMGGTWALDIESWTPTYEYGTQGKEGTETTKTMLDTIELDELVPWSEIDSIDQSVSGVAYYTTSFTLDGEYDGALIDLGSVYDVAKVYINGTEVIIDEQALTADIGACLVDGENELMVEVPTGLRNIIKTLSLEADTNSNITRLDWADNGLYGEVVITPYVDIQL